MGRIRGWLRRLERRSEAETLVARCEVCGEQMRVREGIFLDLMVMDWQMNQEGKEELPADTPANMRWVADHGCDPLELRDKSTGEHIFGPGWERSILAQRGG